jgi:hypothetical protein
MLICIFHFISHSCNSVFLNLLLVNVDGRRSYVLMGEEVAFSIQVVLGWGWG